MKLKFTKMHGIGNDFVVLDGVSQSINLSVAQNQYLSDRHFGIGCDQILLVEKSNLTGIDFSYRIFNADGAEVEQCGNGARCFARFVKETGLSDKSTLKVSTKSGVIELILMSNDQVLVNMGAPKFSPTDIPLASTERCDYYTINFDDERFEFGAVSMGNPHAVLLVDDVDLTDVARLGELLEAHLFFPERANVGFMQIVNRQHIKLRVYERGAAETLACGSGACAAMALGHQWGKLDDEICVSLPGGDLQISWVGENNPVMMVGSASFVYEGVIEVPDI